ncbi:MAG: hypothetical protein ACJ79W_13795 [Myxococcales bacterium]
MAHRVVMKPVNLGEAPTAVCAEARVRFEEIAAALKGIPEDSPFWASARVSRLRLVVRGWSFFYAVDGDTLLVTEARPK